MEYATPEKLKIFFSSFSSEEGLPEDLLPSDLRWLRTRVWELGQEKGNGIWVAEHSAKHLADLVAGDPLGVIDEIIENLLDAEQFVCVLAGKRRGNQESGTPIQVAGGSSAVSHFEIELFQAAIHGKPIHLFILPGFSPGPRLLALLNILKPSLPSWTADAWRETSREKILCAIEKLMTTKRNERQLLNFGGKLTSVLFSRRGRKVLPDLLFLGGVGENRPVPDLERAESLVSACQATTNESKKLSRMWIAARELMPISYLEGAHANNDRFLIAWNRVLGGWASAASWSGLHAHLFAGTVAALNSQLIVREKLRSIKTGAAIAEEELRIPYGALSSSYYSIAKNMQGFWKRRECLNRANYFVNKAIELYGMHDPGLFDIRGSINMRKLNFVGAVRDYEECINRKQNDGISLAELGGSLAELGYALWCSGKFRKGEELVRQGVGLLEAKGENGFLLRAWRKLAIISRYSGRLSEARLITERAIEVGHRLRIYDQVKQLKKSL